MFFFLTVNMLIALEAERIGILRYLIIILKYLLDQFSLTYDMYPHTAGDALNLSGSKLCGRKYVDWNVKVIICIVHHHFDNCFF